MLTLIFSYFDTLMRSAYITISILHLLPNEIWGEVSLIIGETGGDCRLKTKNTDSAELEKGDVEKDAYLM